MSGRILIIDSVATNRIVLKVKLIAAQYRVSAVASVSEGRISIAQDRPDLVLMDMTTAPEQALAFCRALRADPVMACLPVIGMGHGVETEDRLAAFRAGVDDTLARPMSDGLLLARIRSLLRAADAVGELRLREDTSRALGFAEAATGFARPGRIAYVTDRIAAGLSFSRRLSDATGSTVTVLDPDQALSDLHADGPADLFVLDGCQSAPREFEARLFRLVADLRSRSETRHAGQIVLLPERGANLGAMALDLGANDVVPDGASLAEMAQRCKTLIARKQLQDRLRDTVKTGLEAALTDPLTGLFNRRYALPHVAAMAERAHRTGRNFAVLAIDIDHFKGINDRFGHAVGDRVLTAIADCLRDGFRAVDLVARTGGEEFLVAMPDTSVTEAQQAAERLRRAVEQTPMVSGAADPVHVTLSVGVAVGGRFDGKDATGADAGGSGPGAWPEDVAQILERADTALYAAKSSGRNTVEVSRPAAA